jgi:hypothetical protein
MPFCEDPSEAASGRSSMGPELAAAVLVRARGGGFQKLANDSRTVELADALAGGGP